MSFILLPSLRITGVISVSTTPSGDGDGIFENFSSYSNQDKVTSALYFEGDGSSEVRTRTIGVPGKKYFVFSNATPRSLKVKDAGTIDSITYTFIVNTQDSIFYDYNGGAYSTGGDGLGLEDPDSGENLVLQYSYDGINWTTKKTIFFGSTITSPTLNEVTETVDFSSELPLYVRFYQSSAFDSGYGGTVDNYGLTDIQVTSSLGVGEWMQTENITASLASDSNRAGDYFGNWISIDENANTLVVGADYDEANGNYAGSAYVFSRVGENYFQTQKLVATDSIVNADYFGQPVQITKDGRNIAIAAQYDDEKGNNAGAVFIFASGSSGYVQTQKLTASEAGSSAGDRLGYRDIKFSYDGRKLIIGSATDQENGGTEAGSVYVFYSSSAGYSQVQKLTASGDISPEGDGFGYSADISYDGTKIIVGALQDEVNGTLAGSAYIFNSSSSGFQQVQKITASGDTTPAYDYFGAYVTFSPDGNTLAVNAVFSDNDGSQTAGSFGIPGEAGSVYIFVTSSSGYVQTQKLSASGDTSPQGDHFGYPVMFSGDGKKLLVGAETDEENGSNAGSAYLFVSSSIGFTQEYKFMSQGDTTQTLDYFGTRVLISGNGETAFFSALYDEDAGATAGSVYIFQFK